MVPCLSAGEIWIEKRDRYYYYCVRLNRRYPHFWEIVNDLKLHSKELYRRYDPETGINYIPVFEYSYDFIRKLRTTEPFEIRYTREEEKRALEFNKPKVVEIEQPYYIYMDIPLWEGEFRGILKESFPRMCKFLPDRKLWIVGVYNLEIAKKLLDIFRKYSSELGYETARRAVEELEISVRIRVEEVKSCFTALLLSLIHI